MSDKNLFAKTLKLAQDHPEMREQLLPLILRHAAQADPQLRSVVIRVASQSNNPELRLRIARALRAADEGEKEGKWEEGSNPSVEEVTEGMSEEDKKKWLENYGKVDKKAATQKLAQKLFPKTPVKIAEQWIQDTLRNPGRVREYLGVPEGEKIPMSLINAAIDEVKGTENPSLLGALVLAKRASAMSTTK